MGETSHVGASVDAEGFVDLFLAVDGQLIEGAGAAGDEAVVDQTQVVNEVTLALLFAFGGALTGLTAGGTVGVLSVHSVDSFLSDGVVVAQPAFQRLPDEQQRAGWNPAPTPCRRRRGNGRSYRQRR